MRLLIFVVAVVSFGSSAPLHAAPAGLLESATQELSRQTPGWVDNLIASSIKKYGKPRLNPFGLAGLAALEVDLAMIMNCQADPLNRAAKIRANELIDERDRRVAQEQRGLYCHADATRTRPRLGKAVLRAPTFDDWHAIQREEERMKLLTSSPQEGAVRNDISQGDWILVGNGREGIGASRALIREITRDKRYRPDEEFVSVRKPIIRRALRARLREGDRLTRLVVNELAKLERANPDRIAFLRESLATEALRFEALMGAPLGSGLFEFVNSLRLQAGLYILGRTDNRLRTYDEETYGPLAFFDRSAQELAEPTPAQRKKYDELVARTCAAFNVVDQFGTFKYQGEDGKKVQTFRGRLIVPVLGFSLLNDLAFELKARGVDLYYSSEAFGIHERVAEVIQQENLALVLGPEAIFELLSFRESPAYIHEFRHLETAWALEARIDRRFQGDFNADIDFDELPAYASQAGAGGREWKRHSGPNSGDLLPQWIIPEFLRGDPIVAQLLENFKSDILKGRIAHLRRSLAWAASYGRDYSEVIARNAHALSVQLERGFRRIHSVIGRERDTYRNAPHLSLSHRYRGLDFSLRLPLIAQEVAASADLLLQLSQGNSPLQRVGLPDLDALVQNKIRTDIYPFLLQRMQSLSRAGSNIMGRFVEVAEARQEDRIDDASRMATELEETTLRLNDAGEVFTLTPPPQTPMKHGRRRPRRTPRTSNPPSEQLRLNFK